jgi:YebC/PmpR family DNA-binding regulatory protein
MSGHSKWSTIKHRKAIKDKRRGSLFSKISREITVAAREGGSGDPEQNPRLRSVLDKARAANMPTANISRAIARGLGKGSGGEIEEVIYEGYGPSGIAVIAVSKTDNRQRTGAQVKHLFDQAGGSLGGPGSASFLFDREGGEFTAKVQLPIQTADTRKKLSTFLQKLQSQEDIVAVYSNNEIIHE